MFKGMIKRERKKIIVDNDYLYYINCINNNIDLFYNEIEDDTLRKQDLTIKRDNDLDLKPSHLTYCEWLKRKAERIFDVY